MGNLHELVNIKIKGEYQDTIRRFDKNGNIVETTVTIVKPNMVTEGISQFMAGLIQGAYSGGSVYLAVGTGSQPVSDTVTSLVAEYTRAKCSIAFVDNTNSVVDTPTSRLAFSVSFAKGAVVATLTEFGLFSGPSSSSAGGGLELDYVAHAPITLDSTLSLSRTVYFSF